MGWNGTASPTACRSGSQRAVGAEPPTPPVDLNQAEHNVVVLLHDHYMHLTRANWHGYVRSIGGGGRESLLPFRSPGGAAAGRRRFTDHTRVATGEKAPLAGRPRRGSCSTSSASTARGTGRGGPG